MGMILFRWRHHQRKEEPVPEKISSMAKLFISKRNDSPKLSTIPPKLLIMFLSFFLYNEHVIKYSIPKE
jgi:hypothetical protein